MDTITTNAQLAVNNSNATRPIGVFDSGLGGLTVARALQQQMPHESILYYGDTAHTPYGDKSPETVRRYVNKIVAFLLAQEVKAVVIACNTVSAIAQQEVAQQCAPIPVYNVIQPAVQAAITQTRNRLIGVIATKTTINSHIYLRQILEAMPSAHVTEKATPLLVPLIEEGWQDNPVITAILEAYLSDTGFRHIDTLILGCTHYPVLEKQIHHYFIQNRDDQPNSTPVTIINSSVPTAIEVAKSLAVHNLCAPPDTIPQHQYFVSDISTGFLQTTQSLFGAEILPVIQRLD